MIMQVENPVSVLQQQLTGQRPMDGTAVSSAVCLAERLVQLKQASPMFAAISFSPEVEALLATDLAVN